MTIKYGKLLDSSIEEVLIEELEIRNQEAKGILIVSFMEPARMSECLPKLEALTGPMIRTGNKAYTLKDTMAEAESAKQVINKTLSLFDRKLLKEPYHKDWIYDFFKIKHYGIGDVQVHKIWDHQDLTEEIEKIEFGSELKLANNDLSLIKVTKSDLVSYLSTSIFSVTQGFSSLEECELWINAAIQIIDSVTNERPFYNKHSGGHIFEAVYNKYKLMQEAKRRQSPELDDVVVKDISNLITETGILTENNAMNTLATSINQLIRKTPKIQVLAHQLGQLRAVASIPFVANPGYGIVDRCIEIAVTETATHPSQLAAAVVNYLYDFYFAYHSARFRSLMITYSTEMDNVSLGRRLMEIRILGNNISKVPNRLTA